MKIKHQSNLSKILLATLAVTLLIGCGVVAYRAVNQSSNDNLENISHEPASQMEKDAGKQSKDTTVNDTTSSSASNKNPNPDTPTTPPSQITTVPMRITASSQNDDVYQIRTLIDQVVSGNCTITLTRASSKVTKSAATQPLAQSSTCQGFDIPISELSPGSWQIVISLSGAGIAGSASGTIEIK